MKYSELSRVSKDARPCESRVVEIDMIADVYAHILDEDRKVNTQRSEEAFYANCDLRKIIPPKENTLTPEVNNIAQMLQISPELTSMLNNLIAQAGVSTN